MDYYSWNTNNLAIPSQTAVLRSNIKFTGTGSDVYHPQCIQVTHNGSAPPLTDSHECHKNVTCDLFSQKSPKFYLELPISFLPQPFPESKSAASPSVPAGGARRPRGSACSPAAIISGFTRVPRAGQREGPGTTVNSPSPHRLHRHTLKLSHKLRLPSQPLPHLH